MSFADDINKFVEKTNAKAEKVCRAVTISVFTDVILKTSVDTGRLRANWQTTVGEPASGVLDRTSKKQKGEEGGASYNEVLKTVQPFAINWLTNNLPYAKVREEEDGMVRSSIVRAERALREEVNKLNN